MSEELQDKTSQQPLKPMVLDYDDVCQVAPFFKGKEKLVNRLFHWLSVDKTNDFHRRNLHLSSPDFSHNIFEDVGATLTIRNEQALKNLPEGAFITVSNHPFGAIDGMALIDIMGHCRPDYKVMVNMILNKIGALRPSFIAVDALASNDPAKRAVSKLTWGMRIEDREWQPSVLRIIQKLKVPVLPIYFHGHNSWVFTALGMIDWRLRTLRLPTEVFNKKGYNFRVSIGDIISPEEQAKYNTPEELGIFLKQQTYKMKKWQQ